MKKILSLVLLIFTIQISNAQENGLKNANIDTEIFCNHCLQCESCDENIFSQIKKNNKGVRFVKVDAEKNIIIVKYNSEKTNIEEIEKAISMAGYKANDLVPNREAYQMLDGCCKK